MKQLFCFTLIAAFLIGIHKNASGQKNAANSYNKNQMTETTERNKEVVRKVYETALNRRDMKLLGELIAEDYTGIGGKKGPAGFEEPITALIQSFPDIQWKIETLAGTGDQVMVSWTWEGTQTGQFQYIAASGKKVSTNGMGIYQLQDGKIAAVHILTDRLGFLQQLDVLPQDIATIAKGNKDQVRFIDKFIIPQSAIAEFTQRMNDNRGFIKHLPGFIRDDVYQQTTDEKGYVTIITMALWANQQALDAAKEKVRAEYKRIGFDPIAFCQRLNIKIERGVYKTVEQ